MRWRRLGRWARWAMPSAVTCSLWKRGRLRRVADFGPAATSIVTIGVLSRVTMWRIRRKLRALSGQGDGGQGTETDFEAGLPIHIGRTPRRRICLLRPHVPIVAFAAFALAVPLISRGIPARVGGAQILMRALFRPLFRLGLLLFALQLSPAASAQSIVDQLVTPGPLSFGACEIGEDLQIVPRRLCQGWAECQMPVLP